MGWHCDCVDGFIGHECEIEVSDCVSNSYDPTGAILHSCYHGSSCKNGDRGFYCDCDDLNKSSSATASKFAGLMCEHEATSLCAVSLVQNSAPNKQFCTNHGKCVKMVTEGEAHPGCDCREFWTGDHCEIRADPFAIAMANRSQDEQGGGNQTMGKVLFSILIVLIAAVVTAIIVLVAKANGCKVPAEHWTRNANEFADVGDLEADGSGTLGQQAKHVEVLDADGSGTLGEEAFVGQLEADGSGTLGQEATAEYAAENPEDESGLELKEQHASADTEAEEPTEKEIL